MKKLKLVLFLGSVFAISAGFLACSDTTTTDPASLNPSMTFQSPDKASSQVDRYEEIQFNFTCTYNLNTKKDLKTIRMVAAYSGGGTETLIDSIVPSAENKSKLIEYVYTVKPDAPYGQVITITVTVEDDGLKKATKVFTFTVTNLSDLNYYNVTMGAQSNVTLGSYFASDSGTVMLSGKAKSNQSRIDFCYFFNENGDGNSIAAPSSVDLANNTNLVALFTTKNATQFKLIPIADPADFDKIRSAIAVQQLFNAGGTSTDYIKTITAGGGVSTSYIAFKTVKNKFGIMKVVDIIQDATQTKNSVVLDVRVQK